eukprot:14747992-Alexandrium_andersonii.AAC.1
MSASLVGSEMCIRDRAPRAAAREVAHCAQLRSTEALDRAKDALGCQTPVSYTHLTLPTICSV